MEHLSEDEIDDYCLGRLAGTKRKTAAAHLMTCWRCQWRVKATWSLIEALKMAAEEKDRPR